MRNYNNLVGKIVDVINPEHWDYKNWGRIVSWDGEYFHVTMNDGDKTTLVFERSEFKVRRIQ